jgi:hypothetical protein
MSMFNMQRLGGMFEGLSEGLGDSLPWLQVAMSHSQPQQMDAMTNAYQHETEKRKRQKEEAEKDRLREGYGAAASKLGITGAPAELMGLDPDLGRSIIADRLKTREPKEPADRYKAVGDNLYDMQAGSWVDGPSGAAGYDDDQFKAAQGLRKEVTSGDQFNRYSEALPVYESMVETLGRDDKFSDLNLVYGLAKIMDPTSVVREGEQIMVQNSASLPQYLIGQINAVSGGAALRPDVRAKLMKEAESRVRAYHAAAGQEQSFYGDVADSYQIPREHVLPRLQQPSAIPLPSGGTLTPREDGEYEWGPMR